MLRVVADDDARVEMRVGLDEIVREGARRMLAVALEAEVDGYVAVFVGERDKSGHRFVTRNGHAEPRMITTAAGGIEIEAPRVNDQRVDEQTGERRGFKSVIVPPWCRKSPKVTDVLPLMYLHGMSSGDFAPALEEFFGSAAGLSASVIAPLSNLAPARTRATRCGALTARHRDSAASMSLKAMASPAAREPGPLVTLVCSRTTVPAGWTLVRTVNGVSKQKVFSKVATGSEPASIPVTLDDSGEQTVGVVLRVQGTDGVDVHVGTSGESTTAAGSLTTTVANDLLVGFQGAGLWDSTVQSATPPAGWVESADVMSAGMWRQASTGSAGQATAGASGTKTFTLSEAASWTLVLVALKPATTSGGGGGVSGRSETLETLSPSGRVLARTVTDMATNTITENVVFGYASGSDSPAYSKNLMTNVVSTYLGSVNYTGSTGSWPISNAHGDNVGVTDVNATFVANPATDEYGRGVAPADRLGWLGAHYRFNIGGTQNLTRRGVRLYDPNLGRFLQTDPIEGGCANDYDYVAGDPVNNLDLTGTHKRKCGTWGVVCKAHNAGHAVARAVDKAKRQAETMLRTTGIPIGGGGLILRKPDSEFDREVCKAASTFNGMIQGPGAWVSGGGFLAGVATLATPVAKVAAKASGIMFGIGAVSFFYDAGCRAAGK